MKLRDYQQQLYNDVIHQFCIGNRRVLAVAPCGAGKSYIFAEMVTQAKGEVLILTHRQELFYQHDDLLKGLGLSGKYRIAMIQTEARHLGEYPAPSLVVSDEAHLSGANNWTKVIEYYLKNPQSYTIGFTATPTRLSGAPLGDIYDTLIDSVSVKWLIDNNRLAPYEYYAPMTMDMSPVRSTNGDYVLKDLADFMSDRAIYGSAIDEYKKLAYGEKTIVYTVSVNHAKKVAEMFCEAGINASWLCGGTPYEERVRIMDDFRSGKITVLCNVGIISEGVSIDDVTCCVLLRPTESIALGVQQMMRCMRYLPGKTAKIIDCVGNYTRIGLPDTDREWSLTERTKKIKEIDNNGDLTIRTCPNCFKVFKQAPICPYCGTKYPLSPRELKEHDAIELQRITEEEMERVALEKKRQRQEVGRCRTLDDLWTIARERGYKPGWVYQMAKAKGIRA